MDACQGAGIAAGVVNDCGDLYSDSQLVYREHFVFMDHPEMGRYASDANAFRFSELQPEYKPAPILGQHTDSVLSTALGINQIEVDRLRQAGALE